ncbi:urotensin-2 receptor-like [Acipenser ruthenus]|uniref:urotensin-2 receptor-like n=1 Tax=Acipenser ruthenus TaxID=7906 RepID=UPI002740925E|nr:urotensin-2 receptor-like [Acipenser ruthenus]
MDDIGEALSTNHTPNASSSSPAQGPLLVTSVLGATLTLMCLLGATGNIYILAVSSTPLWKAGSLHLYIVNLALADLLYLSTIPFVVSTYFTRDWLFGETGCRVLLSLDLLAAHGSVFTLTAMSAERYRAVVRPFRARRSPKRYRALVAAGIWLASFLLTLPMMVMIRLRKSPTTSKRICFPTWKLEAFKAYLTVLFSTSVLAPGFALACLYGRLARAYWTSEARVRSTKRRLKHRVACLTFGIVVAYWACFLPFWAWQLAKLYSQDALRSLSDDAHAYVNFSVTCLTYSNSCINPFLYTLLSKNYRDYARQKRQPSTGTGMSSGAGGDCAVPGGGREASGGGAVLEKGKLGRGN